MTEGGLLYVALATGIVVIALQALVLVRAGLARAMLDARWRKRTLSSVSITVIPPFTASQTRLNDFSKRTHSSSFESCQSYTSLTRPC